MSPPGLGCTSSALSLLLVGIRTHRIHPHLQPCSLCLAKTCVLTVLLLRLALLRSSQAGPPLKAFLLQPCKPNAPLPWLRPQRRLVAPLPELQDPGPPRKTSKLHLMSHACLAPPKLDLEAPEPAKPCQVLAPLRPLSSQMPRCPAQAISPRAPIPLRASAQALSMIHKTRWVLSPLFPSHFSSSLFMRKLLLLVTQFFLAARAGTCHFPCLEFSPSASKWLKGCCGPMFSQLHQAVRTDL